LPVRWLHLSDIHESKRDGHLRRRMYANILEEVKRQNPPDLVFLTGDLAFAGKESEYLSLECDFIAPLKELLPRETPIFMVPGNHDLDRERSTNPRAWFEKPGEAERFQSTGDQGAIFRKDVLLPRFAAYSAFDRRTSAWGSAWLESEAGSVSWSQKIGSTQVAVVGLNTAWLSHDDHDWGKLTPGRQMIDAALSAADKANPDLLFVLGHHPIEALVGDGDDSDGQRFRERLKQKKAIYLHGHRHATATGRIGYEARSALTIQAPSAYQAHDKPRWRNGLIWAEARPAEGRAVLEPRIWNEETSEYNWDIGAGYEADQIKGQQAFAVALPGSAPPVSVETPMFAAPEGWEIVDGADIQKIRADPPSREMMAAFFDGFNPTWRLALAENVKPRAIMERLTARLRVAHGGASRPIVLLLSGAGGEGKSTAVLQTAADLLCASDQHWICLHRHAAFATAPQDFLANLPIRSGVAWLIAADDADNIGEALILALKSLGPRTDVHLLLAARDSEWQAKHLAPGRWAQVADFHVETLRGLSLPDARRIVEGWAAWGDDAMGKLKGSDVETASKTLVGLAYDLAARPQEGALLGALLGARHGDDMRGHVRKLLLGLSPEPVVGKRSLRDIYVMVAAMHAENQLYLTHAVLAGAAGCEVNELEAKALRVLRREAMLDAGDTYVLTRHRRIAEEACAVLREENYDIDQWYPVLARTALRRSLAGLPTPEIGAWRIELPEYFVGEEGRWPVAREIAKALYEAAPADVHRAAVYSSILRRTGCPALAMRMLRDRIGKLPVDRGLFYEWSSVAGAIGEAGIDAWSAGKSLADDKELLSPKQCKLSLSGAAAAFRSLFKMQADRRFLVAEVACGRLGMALDERDDKATRIFEGSIRLGVHHGVPKLSSEVLVDAIRSAVVLGSYEIEAREDQAFFEDAFGDPENFSYRQLLELTRAG